MVISVNHNPINTNNFDKKEKVNKKIDFNREKLNSISADKIEDNVDIKSVVLSKRLRVDLEQHKIISGKLNKANATIGIFLNTLESIDDNLTEVGDLASKGSSETFSSDDRRVIMSSLDNLKSSIIGMIDTAEKQRPDLFGNDAISSNLNEIYVPLTLNRSDNGISIDISSIRNFFSGFDFEAMNFDTVQKSIKTSSFISEMSEKIKTLKASYGEKQSVISGQQKFFKDSIKIFDESIANVLKISDDDVTASSIRLEALKVKQRMLNKNYSIMESVSKDFIKNFSK